MKVESIVLSGLLVVALVIIAILIVNMGIADKNCDELYAEYSSLYRKSCDLEQENKTLKMKINIANAKCTALLGRDPASGKTTPKQQENASEIKIEASEDASELSGVISVELKDKKVTVKGHSNMMRCMDYRTLTSKASDQYKLQHDEDVITEYKYGIRALCDKDYDGDVYYCVAMGGAFGYEIGDAWSVELQNGTKFNVVLGDYKHPIGSYGYEEDYGDDDINYMGDQCISVLEFIVDMDNVPIEIMRAGTMTAAKEFGGLYSYDGDIREIKYIGRVWNGSTQENKY